ncbi:MAG: cytochrome c3 family protein [Oligoflexia bacterium]|nr:cytochrome c3 family protein [Oligoflexia bacterium]
MRESISDKWVMTGLALALSAAGASCTRLMDPPADKVRFPLNEPNLSYPHSDEFKRTAQHGQEFLRDSEGCLSCHSEKPTNTVAKSRTCKSCHESYPHTERFKLTALHGKQYSADPNACTSCHGKTLDGGDSKLPSCAQCHSTAYPHSEEFKNSAMHGQLYQADRETCLTCHGSRKSGRRDCNSCHEAYPHTAGFKNHGKEYKKAPQRCTTCHIDSPVTPGATLPAYACTQCHSEYPHSKQFKNTGLHGNVFLQNPESCVGCHNRKSERKSCNTCHDPYPHSTAFKSSGLHGKEYQKDPESCVSCHQEGRSEPSAPVSCSQCHSSYPHNEDFKKTALHGSFFLQQRDACLRCHVPEGKGTADRKDCQACHPFPHDRSWALAGNHGLGFLGGSETASPAQKKKAEEACLKCHGETSKFRDKHPKDFVSCGSCHVLMPHAKKFKSGAHSEVAQTYEGKCTACHTEYKRLMPNSEEVGCFNCHDEGQVTKVGWTAPAPAPAPAASATPAR